MYKQSLDNDNIDIPLAINKHLSSIKNARESLNNYLNQNMITRFLNPDIQLKIEEKLNKIIKINYDSIDLREIYNKNENIELKYK